jgi:hypothetical protein
MVVLGRGDGAGSLRNGDGAAVQKLRCGADLRVTKGGIFMLNRYKICRTMYGNIFVMKRKFLFWKQVMNYDNTPLYFATKEFAERWIETDKILSQLPRMEEIPQ